MTFCCCCCCCYCILNANPNHRVTTNLKYFFLKYHKTLDAVLKTEKSKESGGAFVRSNLVTKNSPYNIE